MTRYSCGSSTYMNMCERERQRQNTCGRTESGNFEGMLCEGRLEDEIIFLNYFGEHTLGIHEDLILPSIKEKKIMV